MKRHFICFMALFVFMTMAESCTTTSKLYRFDDPNKFAVGQLTDSTFTALRKYLTNSTNAPLKDTIIIKYDYNHETCWNLLDQSEDDHIMSLVREDHDKVRQVVASRRHVSVFNFREPGNSLNKFKKWNNLIIVDNSKTLLNLLFKERCTCGNSIILLPDKRYVFLRSDSHSEALNLTQKLIERKLLKR